MLPALLALATLMMAAPTTIAPISVNFTKDSVYKYESIITPSEVVEQENGLYTLVLEEDKLLGYCIYDNSDTPYLDGLKFDDEFVTNYTITDVDFSVEHTILVKTIYTNDVAGMLAAAKDGDWSKVMSNPLILIQLGYYVLAAISLIIGGFGLLKSKKKKIKDHDEIASAVSKQSVLAKEALVEALIAAIIPTFKEIGLQNASVVKALIMSKSNDNQDMMSLLDMLKSQLSDTEINNLVERIKAEANNAYNKKLIAEQKAKNTIKAIAEGNLKPKKEESILEQEDDGTSI